MEASASILVYIKRGGKIMYLNFEVPSKMRYNYLMSEVMKNKSEILISSV